MSDNKNKNPVIGLAFLIAATAGGYYGGHAIKPYYDDAVDYAKTAILEPETAVASAGELSEDAKIFKDKCNLLGGELSSILLAKGVEVAFNHTYAQSAPDSQITSGQCSMEIVVPGYAEPVGLVDIYAKIDKDSTYYKAEMIKKLMDELPQDSEKILNALHPILKTFPKTPNP